MWIIEALMFVGGLAAIVTGKLPAFLFGGGQYTVQGLRARLFGVLFVLPLGIGLVGGVLLTILFGKDGAAIASATEIISVVVVLILAVIIFRLIRQPVSVIQSIGETAQVEAIIAKKAQGALIYSLLGILGFTAVIVCPLAFVYARQALHLIDEHKVGEQHRKTATLARTIAPIIFLFYAGIAAFFILIGALG